MRESEIEKAVCDHVKKQHGIAYKFTSPGRRNVPDRMIVLPNGRVFFIEFKAPKKKPTEGQIREHQRLIDRGQTVYVVDDKIQGYAIINEEMQK